MNAIEGEIQQRLITHYGIPSNQVENLYQHLFFKVTKLLTTSGLKKLSVTDRMKQLVEPILNEAEELSFENFNRFFSLLNRFRRMEERQDKQDERQDQLEERQDRLEMVQLSLPKIAEVKKACANITNCAIQQITANRPLIHREVLSEQFAAFLHSPSRYCLLLGNADMGKSTLLAMEAQQLLALDWSVLFLRRGEAPPAYAAAQITADLERHGHSLFWRQVVKLIEDNSAHFLLILDALDEADRKTLASSFRELIDSIAATEAQRFKVIVSCKRAVWENLFEVSALLNEEHATHTTNPISTLTVTEFSGAELDEALAEIGADELLPLNHPAGRLDAHTSALRNLLKHPAAFHHYAKLRQSGQSVHSLTWDGLVKQSLDYSLQEVRRLCGWTTENLRKALRTLATCAVKEAARDFNLDDQIIRNVFPQLYEIQAGVEQTALQALIHCDLLQQTKQQPDSIHIGFRDNNLAAYLLSFDLEEQLSAIADGDLRTFFVEINGRNWEFPAWWDALLALLNRWLKTTPRPPRLRKVFKALLENHYLNRGSVINLLTPDVLSVIFELYQRNEVEPDFYCTDAAMAVRNSPESAAIARCHLHDPDDRVRRLAASLAGNYQDAEAIGPLIDLLSDTEHSVRSVVYRAFGKIGRPSLPKLLAYLQDATQELSLRKNCAYALRNVGYRDDETSASIDDCLSQNKDTEFLSDVLLTAAALRDGNHIGIARFFLRQSDPRVVHAAAKYLTVCPSQTAFDDLQAALSSLPEIPVNSLYHSLLPSQLITALLKTDRKRALPIVLPLLLDGVRDNGLFKYSQSVQILRKQHIHEAVPTILRLIIAELQRDLRHNQAWHFARHLETIWNPEELAWLANTVAQLQSEGTDAVAIFVDAIANNIHISEEFPIGDSLNRIQDLTALVKAQAPNVLTEAFRLVPHATYSSLMELCEWLWVAGETRAEEILLKRLRRQENPTLQGQKDMLRMEQGAIASALGTCGNEHGAAALLDYLQNDDDLFYGLVGRGLVPLLIRGHIKPAQLAAIVKSQSASPASRELSFMALHGISYLARDKELLFQLIEDSSFDKLQHYAVLSLSDLPRAEAVPELVKIFRARDTIGTIKAAAALALSRFRDLQFVDEIENEFAQHTHQYLLQAVANYGQASSVPLVMAGLANADRLMQHLFLKALGSFVTCEEGYQAISSEMEKWEEVHHYLNSQSPLIEGLLPHAPNLVLQHFRRAYDNKYLQGQACATVAKRLRHFHRCGIVDRTLLLETTARLVCERKVSTRETAAQSLLYADADFRQTLFARLTNASATEWQRACGFYTLAYGREEPVVLASAQYDREVVVRKMADEAVGVREKRSALETYIKKLTADEGLIRLSAYLCMKEQGTYSTLWQLSESVQPNTVASSFLAPLGDSIKKRLENEHKEREREEAEFQGNRGTIPLD